MSSQANRNAIASAAAGTSCMPSWKATKQVQPVRDPTAPWA